VAEGQLALLVETNHLGDSKHSWPPPCTDTILTETCHRMHDRSYRSGGRDEQAADLFTQKLDGVAWGSKPSSYIVATKDRTVQPELKSSDGCPHIYPREGADLQAPAPYIGSCSSQFPCLIGRNR
jgi:hypothetical protein